MDSRGIGNTAFGTKNAVGGMKLQYSNNQSELFMETATPTQTAQDIDYSLYGWSVREGHIDHTCYHTLNVGEVTLLGEPDCRRLTDALTTLLGTYLQEAERVLVVGLGNGALTADRLGTAVCQRLTIGGIPLGKRTLYSLAPGVQAVTGIPTDRLVAQAATLLAADHILAVDALCARSATTLGKVVQLSNRGLTPGSGGKQTHSDVSSVYPPEISTRTMPCPVVTMGVPTAIRTTLPDGGDTRYLVTTGDADRMVERWGSLLASAILKIGK